jgi:hypothetical protein
MNVLRDQLRVKIKNCLLVPVIEKNETEYVIVVCNKFQNVKDGQSEKRVTVKFQPGYHPWGAHAVLRLIVSCDLQTQKSAQISRLMDFE